MVLELDTKVNTEFSDAVAIEHAKEITIPIICNWQFFHFFFRLKVAGNGFWFFSSKIFGLKEPDF